MKKKVLRLADSLSQQIKKIQNNVAKEVFNTGSRVCAKVIVRQKIKYFSPCELSLDVQFQRRDHTSL